MLSTLLAGLGVGLGLIVAIGAQNSYVLRQGIRREHVGLVVAICTLSDITLIALGTAGIGSFIGGQPLLLAGVTVVGIAVLTWYGITAVRRAWRPSAMEEIAETDGVEGASTTGAVAVATRAATSTVRGVALTTLALTWLNPHVYLDTMVFLGSLSATYAQPWVFAAGAGLGSIAWFSGLGYGARFLAPLFTRPAAWRIFDGLIALVMFAMAAKLAWDLLAH